MIKEHVVTFKFIVIYQVESNSSNKSVHNIVKLPYIITRGTWHVPTGKWLVKKCIHFIQTGLLTYCLSAHSTTKFLQPKHDRPLQPLPTVKCPKYEDVGIGISFARTGPRRCCEQKLLWFSFKVKLLVFRLFITNSNTLLN